MPHATREFSRKAPAVRGLRRLAATLPAQTAALAAVLILPSTCLAAPAVTTAAAPAAITRRSAKRPVKVLVGYSTRSPRAITAIARAAGAIGPGRAVQAQGEPATGATGIQAPETARMATARTIGPRRASQTRVLTLRRGVGLTRALARLRRRAGVAYALPDYVAKAASAEFIPNDPGKSGQPGGWRQMQWNFIGPFSVNAPEAWANLIADGAPGGRGVTVAVLDTGVAYANDGRYLRSPDFNRRQFVDPRSFISRSPYPNDQNGHGTFVAGTIAEQTNNGKGLTGLAYGVKIMPVRVLNANGEGDASTIAKGVRYAVNHGAEVINMSLEFARNVTAADIPELTSALAYAHRHGVVLVAAAGNEHSRRVPFPARDPFVISVGATTEHGCLADYSNYGHDVNIVAPGGGNDAHLPGDPNCNPKDASGRDIFQETFMGPSPRIFGFPGGYEGTSMASPEVSAAAALVIASGVLGEHPTPAAVRYRLEQTARPLGDPRDALDYGHGLLNAAAATTPGPPSTEAEAEAEGAAGTQGHAARHHRHSRRHRRRKQQAIGTGPGGTSARTPRRRRPRRRRRA